MSAAGQAVPARGQAQDEEAPVMRICSPGRPAVCLAVVLALMMPRTSAAAEADVPALLARIRAVGREGAGNVEAARAWKELVGKGPAVLPDVLAGLDDADPTAGNWLRAAVEQIADDAGGKLSPAALEQFVRDTGHAGHARRLAYDLLV